MSAKWIDPIGRPLVGGHSLLDHLPVTLCGDPQFWNRLARVEQRFGKRAAIRRNQPDRPQVGNGLDRRLVHARDYEVRERPQGLLGAVEPGAHDRLVRGLAETVGDGVILVA